MRRALKSMASWKLWAQSRCAIVVLLSVEFLALVVPWIGAPRITFRDVGLAALLTSLSVCYSIFTVTWERVRVLLKHGETVSNLLATWTFPAAVLLPLPLAAAVVIIGACVDWQTRNIAGQTTPYRYIYSNAGVIFAMAAAGRVNSLPMPYHSALLVAAVAYLVVSLVVIMIAMASVGELAAARSFLRPRTHRLEAWTLAIGGTEALMVWSHVPLVWLSLPAAALLQRKLGNAALREADDKATPMAERVWVHVARGVVSASETVSVLRIDTNDPRAASELARMQAGCDAIGYYGGAGLAILLVDCPGSNADALAARMRSALSHGGVEARVAVAAKPRDGQRLEDLLVVTEADLVTFDSANDAPEAIPPQP